MDRRRRIMVLFALLPLAACGDPYLGIDYRSNDASGGGLPADSASPSLDSPNVGTDVRDTSTPPSDSTTDVDFDTGDAVPPSDADGPRDAVDGDGPSDTVDADGSSDAVDADGSSDVRGDRAPVPFPGDAGPMACGTYTCSTDEVCFHPCSGVDPGASCVTSCADREGGCQGEDAQVCPTGYAPVDACAPSGRCQKIWEFCRPVPAECRADIGCPALTVFCGVAPWLDFRIQGRDIYCMGCQ